MALKSRAQDYISNHPDTFSDMPRILTRNLSQWTLFRKIKKQRRRWQASEQNFRNSLDNSLMVFVSYDASWHTLYVNRVF